MAILSLGEVIDLIIMIAALGFIFKGTFSSQKKTFLKEFLFALLIIAPAVVLHEAAHKFVALFLGGEAIFHAHLPFLGIGILLKLLNVGFIFFIPGYVEITNTAELHRFFIALAGPLTNLTLFALAFLFLKKNWAKKYHYQLILTKKINLFLFIFNMLPIPPFDGFAVVSSAFSLLF